MKTKTDFERDFDAFVDRLASERERYAELAKLRYDAANY